MHIMEVGCEGKASLHDLFMESPDNTLTIIEANPKHLELIRATYPDALVHPCAIWKEKAIKKFYVNGPTSCLEGTDSPASVFPEWQTDEFIELETRTFDEFDPGNIDVIDIDIEGSEWFVLEKMISRPEYIFVEMVWEHYQNPYYAEISTWMKKNYYYQCQIMGAVYCYKKLI